MAHRSKKHTPGWKNPNNHEQENFRSSNSKSYFDDYLCDEEIQSKSNGMFLVSGEPVAELHYLKGVP